LKAILPKIFSMLFKMLVSLPLLDIGLANFVKTLDRGFLIEKENNSKARRLILKLSEACDRLPSSLFITGVTGRNEHAIFGGGFGDIYQASYAGKTVALKHMRTFHRNAEQRRIRLVGPHLSKVFHGVTLRAAILSGGTRLAESAAFFYPAFYWD
jgi:hypothetical protein